MWGRWDVEGNNAIVLEEFVASLMKDLAQA
jgi:hypothetical protein